MMLDGMEELQVALKKLVNVSTKEGIDEGIRIEEVIKVEEVIKIEEIKGYY